MQTPCDITYMWTLKYDIDDLIYERDSQTKMTDLWLLGRWGGGGE